MALKVYARLNVMKLQTVLKLSSEKLPYGDCNVEIGLASFVYTSPQEDVWKIELNY